MLHTSTTLRCVVFLLIGFAVGMMASGSNQAYAKPRAQYRVRVVAPDSHEVGTEQHDIEKVLQSTIEQAASDDWRVYSVAVHFSNYDNFRGPVYTIVFNK